MSLAERYGPWAVIAGASEGTGAAFAHKLAAQGIKLVLIARRDGPLEKLAAEIQAEHGVECVTQTVDLATTDACERIVKAVGAREVGLFISNAGSDPNAARFLDRDISVWMDLVQRNVVTAMQCCHHFGAQMKARKKGGLLLVNSGACYGGAGFMAVYAGSKAFELCLAEGLWVELQPHGVDVLTLVLSRTDTPAFRASIAEKGLPLPEGLASPEAVAQLGLDRLPHGPIQNWGAADDELGFAPNSAAARREKVLLIKKLAADVFGDD